MCCYDANLYLFVKDYLEIKKKSETKILKTMLKNYLGRKYKFGTIL